MSDEKHSDQEQERNKEPPFEKGKDCTPSTSQGYQHEPPPKNLLNKLWALDFDRRIEFGVSVVGVLIAAVLALTSIAQWRSMNSAVEASNRQALAAEIANKQSRDAFLRDQRPYIMLAVERFVPTFRPTMNGLPGEGTIAWTWKYTNYGRSPAHNVRLAQKMEIGGDANARPRVLSEKLILVGPLPSGVGYTRTAFSEKTTEAEFNRLKNFDMSMVVFAKLIYGDSSGVDYETHICFYYSRVGYYALCPDGNDIK